MTLLYYTGIGSRATPDHIIEQMISLAEQLSELGFVLRSGGATGADAAFEYGCLSVGGMAEIYLPWKSKDHPNGLYDIPQIAFDTAIQHYHSDWSRAKETTKKIMARNCQQVMGKHIDTPSLFVVCYTKDGCEHKEHRTYNTGGTGQAISYASSLNIPVFNLCNTGRYDQLISIIREIEDEQKKD